MPHSARSKTRITETPRRHGPGHIPHIARNISLIALIGRRHDYGKAVYQRGIHSGHGRNFLGIREFARIQLDTPHLLQGTHHQGGHRLIGQALIVAGHQLILHRSAGSKGGAFRGFQRTGKDILHGLAGRTAEIVLYAGLRRHHVGSLAAIGYDIVDAGGLGDMLAHQIHHMVERFHCIQGGAACLGSSGSMGRFALEGEQHLHVRKAGGLVDGIAGVGMPVEHGVEAVEHALAHHVGLASPALFGRAAKKLHCTLQAVGFQPLGSCNRTGHGTGPEKIVSAGMTGSTRHQHLLICHRILTHPGDGIILRHHSYHGAAIAISGHKCRWNPRNSPLYAESLALQEGCPLLRAAEFLVSGLCKIEYLLL